RTSDRRALVPARCDDRGDVVVARRHGWGGVVRRGARPRAADRAPPGALARAVRAPAPQAAPGAPRGPVAAFRRRPRRGACRAQEPRPLRYRCWLVALALDDQRLVVRRLLPRVRPARPVGGRVPLTGADRLRRRPAVLTRVFRPL